VSERRRDESEAAVVCLPDVPERHHVGELPANVEVVLLPRQPGPLPDLSRVEILVPADWARQLVLAELRAICAGRAPRDGPPAGRPDAQRRR